MENSSALGMLYSPEAQDAFWSVMNPDTRPVFDVLENRETFTYPYREYPDLFLKMALALPEMAVLPVSAKCHDLLVNVIPLLATMPFRQCIFSIHWLNEQAKDSPMGWGTLCYLEALNILNNIKDHEHYDLSRVMVDRVSTVMRYRKAMGLYAQWPLKSIE
jgi:hypothetical protein